MINDPNNKTLKYDNYVLNHASNMLNHAKQQ